MFLKQVYADGRPTVSTHGRKASVRDFYGMSSAQVTLFFHIFVFGQTCCLFQSLSRMSDSDSVCLIKN